MVDEERRKIEDTVLYIDDITTDPQHVTNFDVGNKMEKVFSHLVGLQKDISHLLSCTRDGVLKTAQDGGEENTVLYRTLTSTNTEQSINLASKWKYSKKARFYVKTNEVTFRLKYNGDNLGMPFSIPIDTLFDVDVAHNEITYVSTVTDSHGVLMVWTFPYDETLRQTRGKDIPLDYTIV